MGTGDYYPGLKRPECEEHSPLSSAKVKIRGTIPPLPQYFLIVFYLIKQDKRLHGLVLS